MHISVYLLGGLYMVSSLFRFSEYMVQTYRSRSWPLMRGAEKRRLYEYLYSTLHSIAITGLASISYEKNLFAVHDVASYRVNEGMKLTMGTAFAYFLLDLFQCKSRMYIVHHLCALQLIGSSIASLEERPYRASYLMGMLALFEWNTPLFNLGFLCRDLDLHYTVLGSVWSLNLVLYSLSRLVMIPMLLYYYQLHVTSDENMNIYEKKRSGLGLGLEWMDYLSLGVIYGGSFYWAVRQTQGIAKKVLPKLTPASSSGGGGGGEAPPDAEKDTASLSPADNR